MHSEFWKGFDPDFDREFARLERKIVRRNRLIAAVVFIWRLWSIGLVTAMVFLLGRWSGVW